MRFKLLYLIILISLIGSVFALTNQSKLTEDFLVENQTLEKKEINHSLEIKEVKKFLNKKLEKDFEIRINGKKKTYSKIDSKKLSKFSTKKSKNKNYYLVQFYDKLTRDEIRSLKREGIYVLDNIGNNAYYVSFKNNKLLKKSKTKKFDNVDSSLELDSYLSENNAVRSIEEIDKDFKLSKNLRDKKIQTWNKDKEGNVYLNVQFHRDVTLDRAETLMKEKGFEVISRLESINALTIKIDGGEKK